MFRSFLLLFLGMQIKANKKHVLSVLSFFFQLDFVIKYYKSSLFYMNKVTNAVYMWVIKRFKNKSFQAGKKKRTHFFKLKT